MKLAAYWKHAVLLLSGAVIRYGLHKAQILAADFEKQLIAATFRRIFKGRIKVEKETKLGSVGVLDLKFESGKAVLSVTAGYGPAGASAALSVTEDAEALVDLLFGAIEKASPAGAVVIEESVKGLIKAAVLAIK